MPMQLRMFVEVYKRGPGRIEWGCDAAASNDDRKSSEIHTSQLDQAIPKISNHYY
jgi:hypothetical protein